MKRRLIALVLVLLDWSVAVAAYADDAVSDDAVAFARTVTQTIADMGDNPDVGNRSSGSPAEKQAADFIAQTMKDIGLQNVTVDPITLDNWTFNRGRVYYTDARGEQQFFPLGGFATNLTCDMQEVSVVYVGRGTAEDYEGLDVEGKVVLFDIDQSEDWWVEIPAYEAHVHGALCSLVCNVSGYAYYDADTIGSQDYCGPETVPAFSLSQNSAAILRQLAEENGGEAKVILDVDSVVTHDGQSQNVWGEIPGATEEVISFFAHYDGYYHSFFDDASGVGTMLSIARELVNSGYTPDKTIRFVAHGAEEWGHVDTEYDWSAGAYAEITQTHPEWAETGFVVLNIDGMYPVQGHTSFAAAATYEVEEFAALIGEPLYADGAYGFEAKSPTTCWTEDFGYVRAGVPAIVASHAGINPVMASFNKGVTEGLASMGSSSKLLMGFVLGGMMSIDFGGPLNKAAYVFGTASLAGADGSAVSSPFMASVMVGGMVPPVAIALATQCFRSKFTKKDRSSFVSTLVMGLAFITEGAIPFAAEDPVRVIPSCAIGAAVAGALSMFFGCTIPAPHGGIFVFGVVHNWPMYFVALLAGSVVGAVLLGILKRPVKEEA